VRCAIPLESEAMFCGGCLRRAPYAFDDALAVFEYRFPVDRLVQRFKYAGDLALGRWLAERLADAVAIRARPDLVVATPLANRSLRRRGFNQALVLARHVSASLAIRCEIDALSKVRETPAQEGLDRRHRIENLRDAFACHLRLEGEHVALVDDVVTTGATASALARVLRESGAGRVSLWAVARTPDPALR
jgi:ComF family protein